YLLRAGDQAREIAAYGDAAAAYERALALLKQQGEHERAARTLMRLGLTYHMGFDFQRSRWAYDEGFALWQQAKRVKPDTLLAPAPHPFRLNWGEPGTLDPTMSSEGASGDLIAQLFSGLVECGQDLDVVPDVAHRWEILDGGRTYVFHLRDDVRWS